MDARLCECGWCGECDGGWEEGRVREGGDYIREWKAGGVAIHNFLAGSV